MKSLLPPLLALALIACGNGDGPRGAAPATTTSEVEWALEPEPQDASVGEDSRNADGKAFLFELASAAEHASHVIVVEHSYLYDSGDPDKPLLPERIYRTARLTGADAAALATALRTTDPHLDEWATACIFEPHHRLEFHAPSGDIRTLEICFECIQIEWQGQHVMAPRAIYETLETFVESLGMEADRDWHALAHGAP